MLLLLQKWQSQLRHRATSDVNGFLSITRNMFFAWTAILDRQILYPGCYLHWFVLTYACQLLPIGQLDREVWFWLLASERVSFDVHGFKRLIVCVQRYLLSVFLPFLFVVVTAGIRSHKINKTSVCRSFPEVWLSRPNISLWSSLKNVSQHLYRT